MVYNGVRLLEGKDNDWYEDAIGRVVIPYIRNIDRQDIIILEYPDFSEEILDHKSIYLECSCGAIIPMTRTICGPCQIKIIEAEINCSRNRMKVLEKGIRQKEAEQREILKEWSEYLNEEGERPASSQQDDGNGL